MTNMRRLLKTPTLRMNAGGDLQVPTGPGMDRAGFLARNPGVIPPVAAAAGPNPTDLRLGAGAQMTPGAPPVPGVTAPAVPQAPAQKIFGSGNSFGDAASLRGAQAPQSAQDQQAVSSLLARTPNIQGAGSSAFNMAPGALRRPAADSGAFASTYKPMEVPGLRDGGDLRTGQGGHVPGSGSGDKIPAKYEPGEFVVSNDMLDAAPGLREQLHGLRGNVLAAKGTTPEQADAKAVSGGALRAAGGYTSAEDFNARVGAKLAEKRNIQLQTASLVPMQAPAAPTNAMGQAFEAAKSQRGWAPAPPAPSIKAPDLGFAEGPLRDNRINFNTAPAPAPLNATTSLGAAPPAVVPGAPAPRTSNIAARLEGNSMQGANNALLRGAQERIDVEAMRRTANPSSMTRGQLFSQPAYTPPGAPKGPMPWAQQTPGSVAAAAEAAHGERMNATAPTAPRVNDGRYGAPPNPATTNAQDAALHAANKATAAAKGEMPQPSLRASQQYAGLAKNLVKGATIGAAGYTVARGMDGIGANDAPGENVDTRANVNAIPTGGNTPAPAAQPYSFWSDTEAGRNIGNTANAISAFGGGVNLLRAGPLTAKLAGAGTAFAGGMGAGAHARTDEASVQNAAPVAAPSAPAASATADPAPAAAAPKAGDVRNVDWEGVLKPDGTQDQFDGKVWRSVSTAQGKVDSALRSQQYQARLDKDAATSRADQDRQNAYFEREANAGKPQFINAYKAGTDRAQAENSLRAAQLQSATAMRGQDITERDNMRTNETSLRNSRATNMLGMFNAQREQGNRDRDHELAKGKFTNEVAISEADRAKKMFAGTQFRTNDKGEPVEDHAAQEASYQAYLNMTDGKVLTEPQRLAAEADAKRHGKLVAGMRQKAQEKNDGMWNTVFGRDALPTDIAPNAQLGEVGTLRGAYTGHGVKGGDYDIGGQMLPGDIDEDVLKYQLRRNQAYAAQQARTK